MALHCRFLIISALAVPVDTESGVVSAEISAQAEEKMKAVPKDADELRDRLHLYVCVAVLLVGVCGTRKCVCRWSVMVL